MSNPPSTTLMLSLPPLLPKDLLLPSPSSGLVLRWHAAGEEGYLLYHPHGRPRMRVLRHGAPGLLWQGMHASGTPTLQTQSSTSPPGPSASLDQPHCVAQPERALLQPSICILSSPKARVLPMPVLFSPPKLVHTHPSSSPGGLYPHHTLGCASSLSSPVV